MTPYRHREVDAAYIYLRDLPYSFGESVDYRRRVDYAADHQPIGIELLYVSDGVNISDLPSSTLSAISCTNMASEF